MDNSLVLITAALLAKVSHIYYSKQEPDVSGFVHKTGYLFAAVSIAIISTGGSLKDSAGSILIFGLAYLTALLGFIGYYRGSSRHPLASFPGSQLAKCKFPDFWWAVKGKTRLVLQELHREHGDIVRIGPNSLSFANPAAVVDIHGAHGLTKGPSKPESPLYSG